MEDPVEISRRIERLVKRVARRDDYGQLLTSGQAIRRVENVDDPDAWRAAIRRQARADRIKVRTGVNEHIVWALLSEGSTAAREEEGERYGEVLALAVPRAIECRHEPVFGLRDGDEALLRCDRCDALGYADAASGPLIGGALFEDACPHDEPPKLTNLAFSYGGRRLSD